MCRIFYALATGIWEDAAYANYVSIVEHGNNRMVGWLEGLEGLCSLFFAIPFGTLADRWRRDRVLRISSCIELGAHSRHPRFWAMRKLCRSNLAPFCYRDYAVRASMQMQYPLALDYMRAIDLLPVFLVF